MKTHILSAFFLFEICSCMNDKNFRCELQNTGTVRISFTNASIEHLVRINYPDGKTRQKTWEAGLTTDTLELPAGSLSIWSASLNHLDDPVYSELDSVVVEQCGERLLQKSY